jgi:murein L,D-transpeptidase YafK
MNFLKSKIFIILMSAAFAGAIFFVLNQFLVMPWEKFEMPKLENPRLVVKKSERKLYVFDGEKLIRTYDMVLGFAPVGDKEKEGDGKTPEGDFYVFAKNDKSKFYLSLGVSYPSTEDAERGLKENLISREEHDAIIKAINDKKMPPQNTRLGGEVYIHGGGIIKDWTWGCVALRDGEMKEIFDAVEVGTSVRIEP